MLTDKEISDIKNHWRAQGGYVDFLSTQFARAIERAVLAKAGLRANSMIIQNFTRMQKALTGRHSCVN